MKPWATTTPPPQWQNWGRTAGCTPSEVIRPTSPPEVAAAVVRAAATGTTIKAIGAGHSFSPVAVAPAIQLDMSGLHGLLSVDAAAAQVTLRAGTRLHEIPALLAPHGLAMTNLGDIDRQSIAGATSTGTHGTGARFGGMSTQIISATVVCADGAIRSIDARDPDLAAFAVGLGALGVLVDITLQCVPAFSLRAEEYPLEADDAFDGFADRVAAQDHHEFFWFPHTRCALGKTNTRLDGDVPRSGAGRMRRYIDDEILSNRLYAILCAVGAKVPAAVPLISQLSGRVLSARTYTDSSTGVFISPRTVRFREMEYAVPLDSVAPVLREIRKVIDHNGYRVSFPIEVRAAAADDLMLSTASGRPSGYIAVHRYHRDDLADSAAYFAAVEAIMAEHQGRPHWGKMHTHDHNSLRCLYPRFDEFLAVRQRCDPQRIFANEYLTRVLGQ